MSRGQAKKQFTVEDLAAQTDEQIEQRLAELDRQRLAQLQMSFVTAVSHELRTPLTVIGSAADNIARGGVIDEDALLAAVREKRIGGAGLDVFRTEPLPPDHPFWKEERVLVTARMAGASDDYHTLTIPTIKTNLECFLEGRLQDMINVVPH